MSFLIVKSAPHRPDFVSSAAAVAVSPAETSLVSSRRAPPGVCMYPGRRVPSLMCAARARASQLNW